MKEKLATRLLTRLINGLYKHFIVHLMAAFGNRYCRIRIQLDLTPVFKFLNFLLENEALG